MAKTTLSMELTEDKKSLIIIITNPNEELNTLETTTGLQKVIDLINNDQLGKDSKDENGTEN